MIRGHIIRIVFFKELREMLRDRRSLAVTFGLPLVLYPLLAIGISTLGQSKIKQLTEKTAHVALIGNGAPELEQLLAAPGSGFIIEHPKDPDSELKSGSLDAIIEIPPRAQSRAIADEAIEMSVRLDRSRTSSAFAEKKINKAIADYERWVIEQRLKRYDAPPAVLTPVTTKFMDVAGGEAVFGKILAQMLPLLLLMMGMLGALFPALNATTTERELGTLETLLVTPAGRTELLLAKAALVLLSALFTAGLNMLSMSLVLLKSISMIEAATNFSISPIALLLAYVAAIPALIFFSVIVLIVGLLARNFREANAYATPVMLLPLASLAVGIAEPEITPALLITPVANTTVIIREVLTGRVSFGAFALAFASSCLYAGIVLSLASRVFSSEQLVNPAWEPVSLKGLRRTRLGLPRPRRLPPVDAAMGLFVVCLLLMFYLSPDPRKHGLLFIASINQLLLILSPVLLFAWVGRWDWKQTFRLKKPAIGMLIGAALLGIGLAPLMQLLSQIQQMFWPQDPAKAQLTTQLFVSAIASHPILVPLVIGMLAGICEEMFFRGAIQRPIEKRLPAWAAIFLTALLFAAFHFDLNGLPIRTGLGILLGWLVWRSDSIFPAMAAHGLYDATALAIAAWHVHHYGADAISEVSAKIQLTRADYVFLIVGCILAVVGFVLIRSSRISEATLETPSPQRPAHPPVLDDRPGDGDRV